MRRSKLQKRDNFMRSKIKYFILGPCTLESFEQVKPLSEMALENNVRYFRANIFKPRTSPESFQGLGLEGLPIVEWLISQGHMIVSEPLSIDQLGIVKKFASIIQIGARNMQNFEYLKQIGQVVDFENNPEQRVMLKRGFSNNLDEWLASARYLEQSGVPRDRIILCERGTRNFSAPAGVTLDLALAAKAKMETEYDVIIDPSHGTRDSRLVLPVAKGAMAMDFDGIMVESHPIPEKSVSDAQQALDPRDLDSFLKQQAQRYDWKIEKEFNSNLGKDLSNDRFSTTPYN